jgi:hypothetical protein
MKIRTPLVTLLVGVVIAVITVILSVRAHHDGSGGYHSAGAAAASPR